MMGPSSMGSRSNSTAWPFRGAGMVLSVAKYWILATRAVSTGVVLVSRGGAVGYQPGTQRWAAAKEAAI